LAEKDILNEGGSVTTDHECLHNSITNLAAMIPLSDKDARDLDTFLVKAIAKAEEGDT
jgi:hypothetical protein